MMKKYLIYISLLGTPLFWGQNKATEISAYQQNWKVSEEENKAMAFDADIKLSDAEIALDKKLFQIRKQFLSDTESKKISLYNSSFYEIRPLIENSKLYEVLQTMPKGGLLHTHSGGITEVKWIISAARKYQECYVYDQKDNDQFIFGQLAFFEKGKVPNGFVSLDKKLNTNPDFEKQLQELLTLKRDNLCSYTDYWIEFEKRFKRINLLLPYRPFFKEYYLKGFQDLIKDKVQHVEIRYIFDELYDFQHGKYPLKTSITDLQDILKEVHKSDPQFTLKLIYSSFKFLDNESIGNQLETAFEMKKEFPDMISGFDLVADEAAGHNISFFEKNWAKLNELNKKYGVEMPLFLHAGESNSALNKNVLDIALLNNKRIGHGLNLIYFPKTMEQIRKQNKLVEVSPISNQVLGYVSDMRNHPARVLLSNGIQCSISSDDPSVYGYKGLSYDFWVAQVYWELDVKALKKLVFNSINYSSLNENEKKKAVAYLNQQWNDFVQKTNQKLN
ncbi:adenosine deaminase CECR1 [Chryseobacterium sediminis]|uniref:Adenosine deaminase CECR1 n=1 Tax=Chryseobacterium sediminis TaxID=1679494 RepID=A0ABR6PZ63_9FLAO|nr:adenosine kinase [Chryseobacterium sediminis]MBB6330996.1 adenosine deaminase CECR1 [Chryseobacterium sediminis]